MMTLRGKDLPVPSVQALRTLIIIVSLLLILGGVWLVWTMAQVQVENTRQDAKITEGEGDRNALREDNAAQDSTIQAMEEAIQKANKRLENEGLDPVVVPPAPIPGDPGATGATGATGAVGAIGATGATGPTGLRGFRGLPGESITGPAGPKGEDGESIVGPSGKDGKDGEVGGKGADGVDGVDGADGTDGTNGTNGADGTSAVPFTFLFTIPADETPPDTTPAQTYQCVIPTPGGPFTCELVA